ncbi:MULTISPECIES: competence type IV pilus ATPase ComGA [Bacillaceae]|uniref:Competence protein ComG n=1 Tax=Domibacillus aminovorans TaxID=29332 RepID=A0A177KRK8_9BACI|nr:MULTISPECIES: competence type IV pilus ATPase ComGA [Bacillaceae]OAH56008.1 competence protein ComG [Domibacillus aminovorans]
MHVEQKIKHVLMTAVQMQATDIHLMPKVNGYVMKIRAGGTLTDTDSFSIHEGERMISYLKFTASMDIGEKRKPQSGAFKQIINGISTSLRISTLPAIPQKESLVIRLLPQEHVPSLSDLTLFPDTANKLTSLLNHSTGLVLLSGPTGSGKSTTLYSMIQHCAATLNKHVITLEDPVEKQHDSLLQIQVNEKAGITYATGLKAILRHDPDVIMVGEIRDEETARVAVRSALTGHLVMSTIHARDAAGVIGRLLEFGVTHHEISQTIVGITAQRLVRIRCPKCGAQCAPHCVHFTRQAIVCELLSGRMLTSVLKEVRAGDRRMIYKRLKDEIGKGIAYGYLTQEEWARWVFEEADDSEKWR